MLRFRVAILEQRDNLESARQRDTVSVKLWSHAFVALTYVGMCCSPQYPDFTDDVVRTPGGVNTVLWRRHDLDRMAAGRRVTMGFEEYICMQACCQLNDRRRGSSPVAKGSMGKGKVTTVDDLHL